MKNIKLTQGYVALIDDADYKRVNKFKWYVQIKRRRDGTVRSVYAMRDLPRTNGKHPHEMLHRFILGITDSEIEVDHEDHNGLNNQRYNLRKATHAENSRNKRMCSNNKSGYKGVSWHKLAQKWQANISVQDRIKYLGLFTGKQEAADAYDAAALKYYGAFALTNKILKTLETPAQ